MTAVELHPFAQGTAAVFSMRSPFKESPNEDVAALVPFDDERGILVVADGAGGLRGGAQASSTAVYELVANLENAARQSGILREAVLDGIEGANREIMTLGIGAATTLAVAELRGSRARTYHVGDSQILILGQKGKQKLFTMSHSPVGYALESGLINDEEALLHEDRHYVSNVLGTQNMTIEMGLDVELARHDTLLVACDGLYDNLTSEEIVEILRKGELQDAAAELIDRCVHRMARSTDGCPSKPDDLTLIAYRPDPPADAPA